MSVNHYDLLGVNPTSSQQEIKKAFKRAALKHHPDKGGDEKLFRQCCQAVDVLEGNLRFVLAVLVEGILRNPEARSDLGHGMHGGGLGNFDVGTHEFSFSPEGWTQTVPARLCAPGIR